MLALSTKDHPQVRITEEWLRRVQLALDAKPMRQRELAKKVGAAESTISMLMRGEREISRLVIPISEALQISPPEGSSPSSDLEVLLHDAIDQLPDSDLEFIRMTLTHLLAKAQDDEDDPDHSGSDTSSR